MFWRNSGRWIILQFFILRSIKYAFRWTARVCLIVPLRLGSRWPHITRTTLVTNPVLVEITCYVSSLVYAYCCLHHCPLTVLASLYLQDCPFLALSPPGTLYQRLSPPNICLVVFDTVYPFLSLLLSDTTYIGLIARPFLFQLHSYVTEIRDVLVLNAHWNPQLG